MARDHQRGREKLKDPGRSLSRAVSIFYISAFCLLFLRDCQWQALALAVAVPLAGAFTTGFLPRLFPVDKLLLSLTNFLCALGLLVLYDTNPTYAYHQSIYYFVGLAAMVVCIYLIRVGRSFRLLVWPMMLLSLVLLVLPLFIGKETYGAKNWFYVGGISVQPSEIVKLTLIIVRFREMIFSSPAMKKTYTSQTSSVTPATRRCIFQMAEKVRLRASRSSRTRAISRGP